MILVKCSGLKRSYYLNFTAGDIWRRRTYYTVDGNRRALYCQRRV